MNSLSLLLEQNKGYITEEKTKERLERAAELYNHGLVEKINDHEFIVKGQYYVKDIGDIEPIFTCTCGDFEFRGVICKHIMAVELSLINNGA